LGNAEVIRQLTLGVACAMAGSARLDAATALAAPKNARLFMAISLKLSRKS
jgi:hypothetical protein